VSASAPGAAAETVASAFSSASSSISEPAGDVDDAGAGLHHGDVLGVEQAAAALRERRVQGDENGLREQCFQRHQLHFRSARMFFRDERVERQDFHAEGLRAAGDLGADAAEADHAEGFAGELHAHEFAARPFGAAHRCIGLRDVARQRQHHRQRVFARGGGVGLRRVHDDDAAARSGVDVDRVHADAGAPDYAQAAPCFDDFGVDLRFTANDQRIVFADARQQLGARHFLDDVHGDVRIGAQYVEPGLR